MYYVLKQDPVRLGSLTPSDTSSTIGLLCEDGCELAVPAALLLAASPLLRTILTEHLPPVYSPPVISLPSVTVDDLKVVGELFATGTCGVNTERLQEVKQVFKMLSVKAFLVCYKLDSSIGVDQVFNVEVEASSEMSEEMLSLSFKSIKEEVGIRRNEEGYCQNSENEAFLEQLRSTPDSNDQFAGLDKETLEFKVDPSEIEQLKHVGVGYPCDQCDYQATQLYKLKYHQQVQHKGILYSCSQCKHQSKTKWDLKKHQQTNHECARYLCNQCEYKATRLDSLQSHQLSKHEGVRYPCFECEYKATALRDLKRHQQSKHEGISYPCNECDYQATKPSNLKRHKETKHEGLIYPCDLCEYKATARRYLKRHQQLQHKGV